MFICMPWPSWVVVYIVNFSFCWCQFYMFVLLDNLDDAFWWVESWWLLSILKLLLDLNFHGKFHFQASCNHFYIFTYDFQIIASVDYHTVLWRTSNHDYTQTTGFGSDMCCGMIFQLFYCIISFHTHVWGFRRFASTDVKVFLLHFWKENIWKQIFERISFGLIEHGMGERK